MAISFVGVTTKNVDNGSGWFTVDVPAGVVEGDLLITFRSNLRSLDYTHANTAGWTQVGSKVSVGPTNFTYGLESSVFYRVATSSEPSNYVWKDSPGDKTNGMFVCIAYRGVDTTSPIAAYDQPAGSTTDEAMSTSLTAPADAVVVAGSCAGFSATTATTTSSSDTGTTTERADINGSVMSHNMNMAVYEVGPVSAGSVSRTLTTTGTTGAHAVNMLALSPATGGGGDDGGDDDTPPPAAEVVASSQAANTNNTDVTSVTVSKPTGTAEGDFMVALVTGPYTGSLTWTPPSGWTQVATNHAASVSLDSRLFSKAAGSSEPSTYTWSSNGAGSWSVGVVTCRGVDGFATVGSSTNPKSAVGTTADPVTEPGLTSLDGPGLAFYARSWHDTGGTGVTSSGSASTTELWDISRTDGSPSTHERGSSAYVKNTPYANGANSTGSAIDLSSAPTAYVSWSWALKATPPPESTGTLAATWPMSTAELLAEIPSVGEFAWYPSPAMLALLGETTIPEVPEAMPKILSPQMPNGESFDVRAYGAKGDGTANDQPAVQAAIDAAGAYAVSNGGATVVFPPGQYKLDSETVRWKSNIVVQAYGAYIFSGTNDVSMFATEPGAAYDGGVLNVTLLGGIYDAKAQDAATDATYNVFSIANTQNFRARDVTVRNVAAWHGMDLSAVDGVVIDSCRFEGFKDTTSGQTRQLSEAMQIDNDNQDFTPTKNVLITNCYMGPAVDGSGCGSFGKLCGTHTDSAGTLYENIRVIGNVAVAPLQVGIQGYSWINSTVANNVIRTPGQYGIRFFQNSDNVSRRLTVVGNVITGQGYTGICFEGTSDDRAFWNCTVVGNTIGSNTATKPGIQLNYFNSGSVVGNSLQDGTDDGIELVTSSDNTIANNIIRSASVVGIQTNPGHRNLIMGNRIQDVGAQGIWISAGSTKNVVKDNFISGASRTTNNGNRAIEISSNSGNVNNSVTGNRVDKNGSGNEATDALYIGALSSGTHIGGNSWPDYGGSYGNGQWATV